LPFGEVISGEMSWLNAVPVFRLPVMAVAAFLATGDAAELFNIAPPSMVAFVNISNSVTSRKAGVIYLSNSSGLGNGLLLGNVK